MAEKEPKSKEFHGVPVHRSIVAAIVAETGASAAEIIRELAAQLTPTVFRAVRDKLMPPKPSGLLETALGEKGGA
jgi:hypothetical protein